MHSPQMSRRDERGFTLIELMIALTLFSVAIAGILSVAVTVTQGFREQRQAVAAEAAVRAPLDFLADAIRQASPGAGDPSKVYDFNSCVNGAMSITQNTGANSSDILDMFYASGGVVTSVTTLFDAGSGTTLKVADSSKLTAGDYVMVTDYSSGMLAKIATVGACTSGECTLTLAAKCGGTLVWPAAGFPMGSIVVRAQHARFYISTVEGVTTLMMDPDGLVNAGTEEPFAEGIEDMQIAVGVDGDGNGALSDTGGTGDEWYGNNVGDAAHPTTGIRAIRITLIAQTKTALFGTATASSSFQRPLAEDHAAGAIDSFRRRVLKTTVELRNTTGSL